MLRTTQRITSRRIAQRGLVVVTLLAAAAACKDTGVKPGQVANTRPAPVAVHPETASTPAPSEPALPTNVSYAKAESAFTAKQYGEATTLFRAYVNEHPKNPWGHYMLGLSAWKAGDLERAQSGFQGALALDPKHVKSLVNLGRVLLESDRPMEARKRLLAAITIDSGSTDAYRVLGRVDTRLGRFDEALEAYRTALAIDPDDTWSMNNMGLLLIQQGRYEEALRPLARAVQLAEEVPVFQNNFGIALERTGHYTMAAQAYRDALSADSSYQKAKVSLARVDGRSDDPAASPVTVGMLGDSFAKEVEGWQGQRVGVRAVAKRDSGVKQ
jgi:predicted Zn-dependent protease